MDLGAGYASAGNDIATGFGRLFIKLEKDKRDHETVQAMLDQAKQMQVPDMRTGKPKNFFSDDQLHHIQRLIDQKKYHAAGAEEAALGIGKGMVDRIQTAAAKQAAAAQLAAQRQAAMQQGPIRTTDKTGRSYLWNPHTNSWQADTAMPRNEAGQTSEEQLNFQKALSSQQEAEQKVQRSGFNVLLKSLNLSPQSLFDSSKQEPGTFVQGRGFLSSDEVQPNVGAPNTPPSHVRIGYKPPGTEVVKSGKNKGLPVDPGDPGRVLSLQDFNALRDAQAQLAGPQANQAWQWLNTNPRTTQTDFNGNPWTEDSIKEYDKLRPGVEKQFHKQIAQGFEPTSQEFKSNVAPQSAPAPAFPLPDQTPVASTLKDAVVQPPPDTQEDNNQEE